jgi:hypothetical protein
MHHSVPRLRAPKCTRRGHSRASRSRAP